ncbi:hypothetical protein ACIRQF_07260 [Streptomyces sp. NPDC101191]|uniref:hypothetical protein n=1 Tax=Streptomyces sp. NPDC101191 TaxID=3366126 RepID=UPI0037F6A5AD
MRRIAAAALLAMLLLAGCDSTPVVDEQSYRKGYDAFGGARLPPSDEDRETVEGRCDELLRSRDLADPDFDLVRQDWITGCADAVEGKESRI